VQFVEPATKQLSFPCKAAVVASPPSVDSEPDFVGYKQGFSDHDHKRKPGLADAEAG
jgi:hypothetical protein